MLVRGLLSLVVLTVVIVAFQNCGNTDNYSIRVSSSTIGTGSNLTVQQDEPQQLVETPPVAAQYEVVETPPPKEVVVLPTPTPVVPVPVPTNPDALITSCAAAKSAGKIQTQVVEILFEDPKQVCSWGEYGNLTTKDRYIRARTTQLKDLILSQGSIVCAIDMKNLDEQKFLYDDNIFITLNDYVLASTSNFTRHLESTNGFYKYDWSKLVDKDAQNAKEDTTLAKQYCAGADKGLASCAFPETETVGKVQLNFSDAVIQNILGITSASQIKLGLTTTGDNDSTDCQHVALRFAVTVQYYK